MRNHTARSLKTTNSVTTSTFSRSFAVPSRPTRSPLVLTLAGIAGLMGLTAAAAPATAAEPNGLPQAYSAKIVDTSSLSGSVAPVVSMLPVPTTKPAPSAAAAPVPVVRKKKVKNVAPTTTEAPAVDQEALVLSALPASKGKSSNSDSNSSDQTKESTSNSSLDAAFAALRKCESGGNYKTATGNGYYGAYQFDPRTWRALGYSGLPSEAAPEVQDEAARKLLAKAGWGQWPACSRKLGLR